MLVSSPRVRASLRAIARTIASNPSDHEDLLQEMLIHLWKNEMSNPNQTESWYLQSCKYRGMDYLTRGKSVDSKRRADCVLVSVDDKNGENTPVSEPADDSDFRERLFADEVLAILKDRLTPSQQMLLDALAAGASVSEISETLGCSHQYVSKQRKKIARTLASVLS
jgi:RNA polymerase sigma factor (sigma-70 family)